MSRSPCIFTIPADASFVDHLALGILKKAGDDPLTLARMRVLLPTRRACRTLREAFLRITKGRPILLPQMNPIGDVDEEELSLLLSGADSGLELPPAIAPLQRLFLLTQMVGRMGTHSRGLEQDMALASALGRLMDQIYTEDLDLADLHKAVDRHDFADHWQVSITFLNILSENWPKILEEHGVIDAADRRNRLLKKLAADWKKNPPDYPVIAAGSTGSIPATAELLSVIANLPGGCIVLPGLDQTMDEESWKTLDDTHPQATLRHLLSPDVLDTERMDIQPWLTIDDKTPSRMVALLGEVMRPSQTAQEWQTLKARLPVQAEELNFERYDCANPQDEALIIAMALREALQHPEKTAALVTPDRRLARRVAMACRRWGIEIDDSAGESLSQTTVGTYLRLCMETTVNGIKPVALLNFIKHVLCQPLSYKGDWRSSIRKLDRQYLRGPLLNDALSSARVKLEKLSDQEIEQLVSYLEDAFAPFTNLAAMGQTHPFESWCDAHLTIAEFFCAPEILWKYQDGESAAMLMADLREYASQLPPVTAAQYLAVLESCMNPVAVRPAYGLHPRLMILGQLEARLVKADLMILGGLNEGTWPPDSGVDPWMSRPMRKRFGLPPLERSIGLAAHDFVQAMCAPKVILTRSVRVDGAPTVPSRWLQRMDTVLQAGGLDPAAVRGSRLSSFARQIDHTEEYTPWNRPEPAPPVEVRPKELSVTQIETWMQDPYSIYASHILRLKKLKPLEQEMDAALKGTLIHKVLQKFAAAFPDDIPSHARTHFLSILDEELSLLTSDNAMIALWRPRLNKMADWVIAQEASWRTVMKHTGSEVEGKISFDVSEGPFTLKARADRIDVSYDRQESAIIDYKSGGTFTLTGMQKGTYPQLPLEALILEGNGFPGIGSAPVGSLSYWIVNGNKDGGEIKKLSKAADLETAKMNAQSGLESLVRTFYNEHTPYYSLPRPENAPRFNDYEHLARVLEWTALDEREDAA